MSPAPSGNSAASGAGGSGGSGALPVGRGGSAADARAFAPSPTGNTNISLGGAQDFGYFRALLDAGRVPETKDFDAAGFFAEHHTQLPPPTCGERVCLQTMLAVMSNLSTAPAAPCCSSASTRRWSPTPPSARR